MKRVFLLIMTFVFSASMYAQADLSVNTDIDQVASVETIANGAETENQIKDALKKDETLQKETIKYLKENPETSESVASIIEENKGSIDGVIEAILGDGDLTTTAINWIKDNPEMLSKAMKVVGL